MYMYLYTPIYIYISAICNYIWLCTCYPPNPTERRQKIATISADLPGRSWKTRPAATSQRWSETDGPRCNEGWSWRPWLKHLSWLETWSFGPHEGEFQEQKCVWAWWPYWQPVPNSWVVVQKELTGLGSWVVVFWLEVSALGCLRWCFPCSIIFNLINNSQDGWQPQQQQNHPKHNNNKSNSWIQDLFQFWIWLVAFGVAIIWSSAGPKVYSRWYLSYISANIRNSVGDFTLW